MVGCSNTEQAVAGYLNVSDQDHLVNTARGSATIARWANPSSQAWNRYDQNRPPSGYTAAWVNLCERAETGLSSSNIDSVLSLIWARDPNIPVVMSPLNFYTDDDCPASGGNTIPDQGAVFADQYAAANPLIVRGPDLGPLNDSHTTDNCHLNTTAQALVGYQLAGFFDA